MKRLQLLLAKLLPYGLIFAAAFCLMYFGSQRNDTPVKTPIAANFDSSDFTVTADQVSESYTVANIASALSLPSTSTISENYVTINDIYETTGTTNTSTSTVVEKPTIIDTSGLTRGIESYIVQDGDNFQSIYDTYVAKHPSSHASKDQIRWSNGLKKETVTVGNTMYYPSVAGIVYKVKSGETLDKIIEKTGSAAKDVVIQMNARRLPSTSCFYSQMVHCQKKNVQNMLHQLHAHLIRILIVMLVIPPIVMVALRLVAITIGAAYITALLGSITLAPSVTVLGSPGTGAATT